MNHTPPPPNTPHEPPLPPTKSRRLHFSPIWILPLVAILIGLSMLVHTWLDTGPVITIRFATAAGLTPGKTPVKFKDVDVGVVSTVSLTPDGTGVIATVKLAKTATSLATAHARFWVVRPRLGAGGISGIDTLLSGPYIGADHGKDTDEQTSFIGLETPPTVINGTPGSTITLRADDLGSLDINSPIYYRRIQVGRVASYQLDTDGQGVTLLAFVDAPYDRFINGNTRFWNASGVDVALGADGLKVNTQSLATVLSGGIAFTTPKRADGAAPPRRDAYTLAKDMQTALEPPAGDPQHFLLRFKQGQRGLSVGAPVYFSGMNVGVVSSIDLDYDPVTHLFPTLVGIDVYPSKMGSVLARIKPLPGTLDQQVAKFLEILVARGLRAQAPSGSLITGQRYISLDFQPKAPTVAFDVNARPLVLPTMDGGFDQLEEQMSSILGKLDKVPFDSIGRNLDTSVTELNTTLKQINTQVLPATTDTLSQAKSVFGQARGVLSDDSPLQNNLNRTLEEVSGAARSVRTLTDLLGRHPESLLRGLPSDPTPSQPAIPPSGSKETSK